MMLRTMAATAAVLMTALPSAVQARAHGLHVHRGFGFHHGRRIHCRTYKDQNGHRDRVCV